MARTRIKICGVRDVETALFAAQAGADAIGLMFVESSPRYIAPEEAWEIVSCLPPFVTSVGVTMNLTLDQFAELEQRCPTGLSQLHGTEPEKTVAECGPGIIKAIKFDESRIGEDLRRWDEMDEVDAILVDGSAGGEGASFDWTKLIEPMESLTTPVIVAGGLTPENVGEAIRVLRPYGVDVSSGVEREKGVKDVGLIEAFCEAVRGADVSA